MQFLCSLVSVENFSCTANEVVTVPVPQSINLQTMNGYCLTVKTSNSFYSDAIFDINAIVNIESSDVFYLKPNDSVSGTLNILIW